MTIQKNITMTPRKLRLVADMVRKMTPDRAIEVLQFTNKAAAQPLSKAIKTAVANAGKADNLAFAKIEINEGLKMKRYRAGTAGRGRGRPYRRRMSHIKIVLTNDVASMVPTAKNIASIASKVVNDKAAQTKTVKAPKVEARPAEVVAETAVEPEVVEGEVVEEGGSA